MAAAEPTEGPAPAPAEYTVRHSPARQRRGMRPYGLFRQDDPGLSICVSDHWTRDAAEADCRRRGGQLVQEAA